MEEIHKKEIERSMMGHASIENWENFIVIPFEKLDSYRILENQQNCKQQNEKLSDFNLRIFSVLLRVTRGNIIKDNSKPNK